ncbi:hypothetical protein D9M73_129980 [compost metagenome]
MPQPVSATLSATYSPARHVPTAPSASVSAAAVMVNWPRPFIASRALTARFRTAFSSWCRSDRTSHAASLAALTVTLMPSPSVRSSKSDMPLTSATGSIGSDRSASSREKASNCRVSAAARLAPSAALSIWRRAAAGSPSICRLASSRPPRTTASMLLKSCAMPPVNWPTASIFWTWRNLLSCASSTADARATAASSSTARSRSASASARADARWPSAVTVSQPSAIAPSTSKTPNTDKALAMALERATELIASPVRLASRVRSCVPIWSSRVSILVSDGDSRVL